MPRSELAVDEIEKSPAKYLMSVRGATMLRSSIESPSVLTQSKAGVDQLTRRSAATKEPAEPPTEMDGRRDLPTVD